MLSARKQEALLNSQSGVARNVFKAVPIEAPWPINKIHGEVTRLGHNMDYTVLIACLHDMNKDGLIREGPRGNFKRVPVRKENPGKMDNVDYFDKSAALIAAEAAPVKATNPLDILSSLADRLRKFADEVDEAALEVQAVFDKQAKDQEQMDQLRKILKNLGV